jgi:hypothetical protein
MIYGAQLLHFYQPPIQVPSVLNKYVTNHTALSLTRSGSIVH